MRTGLLTLGAKWIIEGRFESSFSAGKHLQTLNKYRKQVSEGKPLPTLN